MSTHSSPLELTLSPFVEGVVHALSDGELLGVALYEPLGRGLYVGRGRRVVMERLIDLDPQLDSRDRKPDGCERVHVT